MEQLKGALKTGSFQNSFGTVYVFDTDEEPVGYDHAVANMNGATERVLENGKFSKLLWYCICL
jgi:hypothetical protein